MLPGSAWSVQSTKYSLSDTVELHKQKSSQRGDCRVFGRLSRSRKLGPVTGPQFTCAAGCNASLSNVVYLRKQDKVMLQMAKKAQSL